MVRLAEERLERLVELVVRLVEERLERLVEFVVTLAEERLERLVEKMVSLQFVLLVMENLSLHSVTE